MAKIPAKKTSPTVTKRQAIDCLDRVEGRLQLLLIKKMPVAERRRIVLEMIETDMIPLLRRAGRR